MQETISANRFQFWLGIIVSIICLASVLLFIRPSELLEALTHANYALWLVATAFLLIFLIIRAFRWRFLLNRGFKTQQGIEFGPVFHIQNIGYMLTNLLPFRLGDVARAILVGNVGSLTISKGLSTMVVERVFDLLFIVILFPFTLSAIGRLPSEAATAARVAGFLAIAAALTLVVAANNRPRVERYSKRLFDYVGLRNSVKWLTRIDNFLDGLSALTNFRDGVSLILLSICVWIPIIIGYYMGMLAVNIQPSMLEAAFVVCIAALSVTAPSSPGQIGVFEASVTFALAGLLGMSRAQSVSFAFLYHAVNYLLIGLLGVIGINRTSATFGSVLDSLNKFIRSRDNR